MATMWGLVVMQGEAFGHVGAGGRSASLQFSTHSLYVRYERLYSPCRSLLLTIAGWNERCGSDIQSVVGVVKVRNDETDMTVDLQHGSICRPVSCVCANT